MKTSVTTHDKKLILHTIISENSLNQQTKTQKLERKENHKYAEITWHAFKQPMRSWVKDEIEGKIRILWEKLKTKI